MTRSRPPRYVQSGGEPSPVDGRAGPSIRVSVGTLRSRWRATRRHVQSGLRAPVLALYGSSGLATARGPGRTHQGRPPGRCSRSESSMRASSDSIGFSLVCAARAKQPPIDVTQAQPATAAGNEGAWWCGSTPPPLGVFRRETGFSDSPEVTSYEGRHGGMTKVHAGGRPMAPTLQGDCPTREGRARSLTAVGTARGTGAASRVCRWFAESRLRRSVRRAPQN